MGNIGGGEIVVILLVALLVLGPQKLPDAAKQLGKAVREFRNITSGFQRELRDAMNAEEPTPAKVPSGLPEAGDAPAAAAVEADETSDTAPTAETTATTETTESAVVADGATTTPHDQDS